MMGSVYKPNPRCRFYYLKYKGLDGRIYVESSRLDNKESAKKLLRAKETKIDDGMPITPEVGKLTLDDAFNDLVAHYAKKKRRSIDELKRRVTLHIKPFFTGTRRMTTITTADVDRFVAKRQADTIVTRKAHWEVNEADEKIFVEALRKPVSPAEINRELTILRRMFSLAIKNGRLMVKPAIELLAEAAPRSGFFEADEITELCKHLPEEIQPIVRFAFISGWRVSEVLGLEWNRVDFTGRGHVKLAKGTTKNGEARTFPMTIELRQLLEQRDVAKKAAEKATDKIIPQVFFRMVAEGRGGQKLPQPVKSFNKVWKSACVKAGFPGRIPHDLRRSAIRTFVRKGISENTAMALSGHKTSSVFRRYDIVSTADLDEAAAKLDAAPVPAVTSAEKRPARVRKFARR